LGGRSILKREMAARMEQEVRITAASNTYKSATVAAEQEMQKLVETYA
jgi:hypothetical protein